MKRFRNLITVVTIILSLSVVFSTVYAGVDTAKVIFDGEELTADPQIIINNGITLIPFRPIFTKLGMTVEWDNKEKSVTAVKDGLKIKLIADKMTGYVNGEAIKLSQSSYLSPDGAFYVGLRFVSEAAGAKVSWDQKTRTVTINSK